MQKSVSKVYAICDHLNKNVSLESLAKLRALLFLIVDSDSARKLSYNQERELAKIVEAALQHQKSILKPQVVTSNWISRADSTSETFFGRELRAV